MFTTYQGRHRRRESTLVAWARRAAAALLAFAAVAGLAATTATAATHPSTTTQLPGRHADPNWDRHAHATPAVARIRPGRSAPGAENFRAVERGGPTTTIPAIRTRVRVAFAAGLATATVLIGHAATHAGSPPVTDAAIHSLATSTAVLAGPSMPGAPAGSAPLDSHWT